MNISNSHPKNSLTYPCQLPECFIYLLQHIKTKHDEQDNEADNSNNAGSRLI